MKKQGINAAAFMATLSTGGRLDPKPVAAPTGTPRVGQTTAVDRWIGGRWVEVEMTWDGTEYKEAK